MSPRRLRLTDPAGEPSRELLADAATVLARGGIVALPTETVYGIAARADDPRALEALADLKGRPYDKPWTWHVGTIGALESFPDPRPNVRRLAERYWPGPMTLVLPGVPAGLELAARDGWTGIRYTAEPLARALCTYTEFPVVMTSANRHGERPATDSAGLAELDLERVELVIDSGTTRLQEPSTILKIGQGHFELLREGLHDLDALRRTSGMRIGFACTGNTCRSPMAEGLARAALAERLCGEPSHIGEFGFEVRSMGVFASSGCRASAHAIEVMAERGVEISGHASSPALPEVIEQLDVLYCMTHAHRSALGLLLPPGRDGHLRLFDPEERDIPDPVGGTMADYRRCAQHIAECIEVHAREWA